MNMLTDAGFSEAEANSIADHLAQGVDLHDNDRATNPIDLDALSQGKRDAVKRFTMAVARYARQVSQSSR